MPPHFSDAIVQASLDSYLGTVLVQAFVSGIYTLLLFRTIRYAVPSILNGRHILLLVALIVLYALTVVNLATLWATVRSITVAHNETRQTMAIKMFTGSARILQVGNGAGVAAMLIADSLLVWRCYMMWLRNKWLLASFGVLLLGEFALIPILLTLNSKLGPSQVPIICVFFFISMGITIVATTLIIYRILTVSRAGGTAGRYRYVIEILIESGILYSTCLFITGVLQALPNANLSVLEAGTYLTGILIPVTGIAPTLIFHRIMTSKEQDEDKWSQPVSFMLFKNQSKNNSTTMQGVDSLPFGRKTGTGTSDEENLSLGEDELSYSPTESKPAENEKLE